MERGGTGRGETVIRTGFGFVDVSQKVGFMVAEVVSCRQMFAGAVQEIQTVDQKFFQLGRRQTQFPFRCICFAFYFVVAGKVDLSGNVKQSFFSVSSIVVTLSNTIYGSLPFL